MSPCSSTHTPFFNKPSICFIKRLINFFLLYWILPHIIHSAIIGFTNNWINSVLTHPWLFVYPFFEGVCCTPNTESTGKQNRSFNLTELSNLCFSNHFSVAITYMYPSWYWVRIKISRTGNDGSYTCSNIITFYFCVVANFYTINISYGIVFSWIKNTYN